MMKHFSQLTTGLMGQPMFEIMATASALEAKGKKVYHFEIGDSFIDPYPHVVEATKNAIDQGHTRYVGSMGIEPLRQAICTYTEQKLGFRPDLSQVLVTAANSVIDFVARCVTNPGDEIVFPDPGFSTYETVASYLGLKVVRVPLHERNGFRLEPEDLCACITDKTRLVIVNSPGNPTGAVMTKDQTERLAELIREKDVYLLSDEIYAENIYGARHYSPAVLDKCRERTIILNGFSKAHAMSGWRLGYAIGPEELIAKMGLMFNTIYSCVPPFIQYAGISALNTPEELKNRRTEDYRKLRDLMIDCLNDIPGIRCNRPEGALYLFPNITGTGLSSKEFARVVLEEAGVAVVPGAFFGPHSEGFVRLCYVRNEAMIIEACAAMKEALAKHQALGR